VSEPRLLRSELVLASHPFNVSHDRVLLDDGREVDRAVVVHPGAVALVALDEAGRILFVRQYRHPARRRMLEVPAGTREPGEEAAVTAARELREETGFAARNIERIGGTWMAPGFCTEYIDYFLATGLHPDPLPQDADEDISPPQWMTAAEASDAIDRGEIEDAKTVVALALLRRREEASGPGA
jgi:ADP-ribose pyrophosphatase